MTRANGASCRTSKLIDACVASSSVDSSQPRSIRPESSKTCDSGKSSIKRFVGFLVVLEEISLISLSRPHRSTTAAAEGTAGRSRGRRPGRQKREGAPSAFQWQQSGNSSQTTLLKPFAPSTFTVFIPSFCSVRLTLKGRISKASDCRCKSRFCIFRRKLRWQLSRQPKRSGSEKKIQYRRGIFSPRRFLFPTPLLNRFDLCRRHGVRSRGNKADLR